MKRLAVILIALSTLTTFGQTYELNYHEWDTAFPYKYWLTLNYRKEPNQVELLSKSHQDNGLTIEGEITDYRDSALGVLIHRLNPADSSPVDLHFPDNHGLFELNFQTDTVLLRFSLLDNIKTEYLLIESKRNQKLEYSLKLGRNQPFNKYIIHSKGELTDQEIKETMRCIMKFDFYDDNKVWDCDQGQDFFIGITCG